ncbi:MAG TPA: hypothetical protein DEG96_05355 [Candidatus Atribacteria bacterium]|nr:hypothetical protein [Candidatus Atribacteria bacterium]
MNLINLILAKILISTLIVVLLAEISTRINPFFGGLLSGLPVGAGLSVYFICYQKGIPFLVTGIPWGISALSSSILFCLFYLMTGRYFKSGNNIISLAFCSLMGFISFYVSGYFIYKLDLNLLSAAAVFLTIFFINILILKKIKANQTIKINKKNSIIKLLIRGLIAGIIISMFTEIASIAGSRWAGILSSFPSTLFALLLILHFEEQNNLYPSVIYGFSFSISTLLVFYIACWYLLPKLGLNLGFIIVYLISISYLFLLNKSKDIFI